MKVMEKKKLGADIPVDAVDRFNAYCQESGYHRGSAAAAALRLFEWVPLDVRQFALQNNGTAVRRWVEGANAAILAEQVRAALDNAAGPPGKAPPAPGRRTAGKRR